MGRRGLIALLVLIVTLSILGCVVGLPGFGTVRGSGRVAEEERQVSGVTGVELATFGDLTIERGEAEELRIEAEDNLLRYFETEVRNGTLKIGQRKDIRLISRKPVNFYLTVKELDTIVISGSGDVEAPDLEAERFSLTISGSGNLEMEDLDADTAQVRISGSGDVVMEDLRADTFEVDITGSGKLDIAGGEVEEQDITISGSGDYEARGLESAEAEVRISGSGAVTTRVSDYLRINVSGSGDVRYIGDPSVDKTVTGSGKVRQIGD
jgi:carbon monoxide dehydrogenase subunit G